MSAAHDARATDRASDCTGDRAHLEVAERLLLGFVCELVVVDTDSARILRLRLEPAAFADLIRSSIASSALGLAARGGCVDLVDIVGEAVARGEKPDDVIEELAASIDLFDRTLGDSLCWARRMSDWPLDPALVTARRAQA